MTTPVDEFSTDFGAAFDPPTDTVPGFIPGPHTAGVDERVHAAIIKAILAPPLDGHVYDYGGVPGEHGNQGVLPMTFVVIAFESRAFGGFLRAGHSGSVGWRVLLRYSSRFVDEARRAKAQITSLKGTRLVIDGKTSTPLAREVNDAIRPDEDRYSGEDVYAYVL